MIIIGVCKRYNHSTKSKNHPRAKKHWYIFYYDDDDPYLIHTKRISVFMVPYYKLQVKKKRQFYCFICETTFTDLVKKGTNFVPCINGCDSENS